MLTARDGVGDRVKGLDSGADDYLVKPFAYEELSARVRALLRRQPEAAAEPLEYAGIQLEETAHEVRCGNRFVELSALEFRLPAVFIRNPRHVLSRQQILESVWGFENEASSNVVDVYVGDLRSKLEAEGEARVLQTVRGVGYVLRLD